MPSPQTDNPAKPRRRNSLLQKTKGAWVSLSKVTEETPCPIDPESPRVPRMKRRNSLLQKTQAAWASARSLVSVASESSDGSFLHDFRDKKNVRFAKKAQQRIIPNLNSMDSQEKSQVWYSSRERNDIRNAARCEVWDTLSFRSGLVARINDAYREIQCVANSLDEEETFAFLRDPYGQELVALCQKDEIRGLEQAVSPQIRNNRARVSGKSRGMVVQMNKIPWYVGRAPDGETMARKYKEMSRSALILARILGEADATVVEMGEV